MKSYETILKKYFEKLKTNISINLFSQQKNFLYKYKNNYYMKRCNFTNIDKLFTQVY